MLRASADRAGSSWPSRAEGRRPGAKCFPQSESATETHGPVLRASQARSDPRLAAIPGARRPPQALGKPHRTDTNFRALPAARPGFGCNRPFPLVFWVRCLVP